MMEIHMRKKYSDYECDEVFSQIDAFMSRSGGN